MNEHNKKYKAYLDSLPAMQEPAIPDVVFDMRGLIEYAAGKGVKISQLSEEEKMRFVREKTV